MNALAPLRSRRAWLALLVLPALLLRALVPVGFMPMVSEGGGLSIEICPGVGDLPTAMRAHGAGHEHHHNSGGGPSSPAHHAPCLFAASAGAAPTPSVLKLTLPAGTDVAADADSASMVLLPTIVRTQSPRGPPALS